MRHEPASAHPILEKSFHLILTRVDRTGDAEIRARLWRVASERIQSYGRNPSDLWSEDFLTRIEATYLHVDSGLQRAEELEKGQMVERSLH